MNIKSFRLRVRLGFSPRLALNAISIIAAVIGVTSLMVEAFARAAVPLPDLRPVAPKVAYIKASNPFLLNPIAITPKPTPQAVNPFGPQPPVGPNPFGSPVAVPKPLQAQVIGIVVGPKSYAVISNPSDAKNANAYSTVTIGDQVDGRTVIDISLSGVTLSDGTLMAAATDAGAFGFNAPASGATPGPQYLPSVIAEPTPGQFRLPFQPPGDTHAPTPPYQSIPGQNAPATPTPPYGHY